MILIFFRKTTKKPENKGDVITEYVGMVNNISKLDERKRAKKDSKYIKYYVLDTDIFKASGKLDKFSDKLRADYC